MMAGAHVHNVHSTSVKPVPPRSTCKVYTCRHCQSYSSVSCVSHILCSYLRMVSVHCCQKHPQLAVQHSNMSHINEPRLDLFTLHCDPIASLSALLHAPASSSLCTPLGGFASLLLRCPSRSLCCSLLSTGLPCPCPACLWCRLSSFDMLSLFCSSTYADTCLCARVSLAWHTVLCRCRPRHRLLQGCLMTLRNSVIGC